MKEVATIETNPNVMIQAAIQGGADLEQLEKLMVLQERWEANEALKAYQEQLKDYKESQEAYQEELNKAYEEYEKELKIWYEQRQEQLKELAGQ